MAKEYLNGENAIVSLDNCDCETFGANSLVK